ncbi:hypothetical protein NLJ89_g6498 [Agrocybe chaxingu]|uniref:HhH-GPD domain-containing protein n=1 Tax=Agrocybe chaxingu TaxID=84603 RepID=A0A9W8JWD0_9AGAR|nr:hypothetical protein NLJ89_g6498 [Agrocybe chaxingu]
MTTSPTIISDAKSRNVNGPGAEVPSVNGVDGEFSHIRAEHDGPVETPVVEDEEYFLQSSLVFFQVEKTLFHVPSYRFARDSEIFAEMFKLPQADCANVEGVFARAPDHPSRQHLPPRFPEFLEGALPLAEWFSVLKLSSFWYFLKFRNMAIAELERPEVLTPTEKVTWGRDVKISSWVVKGYQEIAQRSATISKDDAIAIGYETAFVLFRLREDRIKAQDSSVAVGLVEKEFKIELESIRAEEKGYTLEEDEPKVSPKGKAADPEPAAGTCSCQGFYGPNAAQTCGNVPNVIESLIGTILSQNTSGTNSGRAKANLDAAFGRNNFAAIAAAPLNEVVEAIRRGGLANKKAATIQKTLRSIKQRHGEYSLQHLAAVEEGERMSDDDIMKELLAYDGVGPKTASCVLLFCLGRDSFAVDTHVFRLSKILGWVPPKADRILTQAHLDLRVPGELKYGLHVLMIQHGRACKGCKKIGSEDSCILKEYVEARKAETGDDALEKFEVDED